ncbi:unnamed protein product, partial [Nesidiocoris tenuis]
MPKNRHFRSAIGSIFGIATCRKTAFPRCFGIRKLREVEISPIRKDPFAAIRSLGGDSPPIAAIAAIFARSFMRRERLDRRASLSSGNHKNGSTLNRPRNRPHCAALSRAAGSFCCAQPPRRVRCPKTCGTQLVRDSIATAVHAHRPLAVEDSIVESFRPAVSSLPRHWPMRVETIWPLRLKKCSKLIEFQKNGQDYITKEDPDIICLQETKCPEAKVPADAKIEGYHYYWANSAKDGYAGVALYTKEKPLNVTNGIGNAEHDDEGRVITAEYDKYFLVATYVPNAGQGLKTLPKRMNWDNLFLDYLKSLDAKKPVILCGDLNVAHQEIDLANPKTNKKSAGFTQEERDGMTKMLSEGFVDSFRQLYPDRSQAYTFWTYMSNARAKNTGWKVRGWADLSEPQRRLQRPPGWATN